MAIGNSGGSAASRFRPRGTAPAAGIGLGRRNLLAEEVGDEPAAAEEVQEEVSSAPERQGRVFGSRASSVTNAVIEHAPTDEPQLSETTPAEPDMNDRSLQNSPSMTGQTAPRTRGRPAGSTKRASEANSPTVSTTTESVALSVSAARARMREIEAELKAQRATLQSEIVSLQRTHESRTKVLRAEYHELSDIVLGE